MSQLTILCGRAAIIVRTADQKMMVEGEDLATRHARVLDAVKNWLVAGRLPRR